MGWAYSEDLRDRVVAAFDAGELTDEEVAELFDVGEGHGPPVEAAEAGDRLAGAQAVRRRDAAARRSQASGPCSGDREEGA